MASKMDPLTGKARKANRALRQAVTLLEEANLDGVSDAWREDILKTLDDVAMQVYVVRTLVVGAREAGDA